VGLGAPYWNQNGRGTIIGITRGTTHEHIARAALDGVAYQTRDVLDAMQQDSGVTLHTLKVDGGATVNNLLMQFQSDILGVNVQRPTVQETTAAGAAYLAGLAVGFWEDTNDVVRNWSLEREFTPKMDRAVSDRLYSRWKDAVKRSLDWERAT
jgi:glycerol kinase